MPLRKQVTWRLQLLLPHPEEESLAYVGMLISLLCQAFHTRGTYVIFVKLITMFHHRKPDKSLHKTPKYQTLMQKRRRKDAMQI